IPALLCEPGGQLDHSGVDQLRQDLNVPVGQVLLAVLGGTGLQVVAVAVDDLQGVGLGHHVCNELLHDVGCQLAQLRLRQAHPSSSSSRSPSHSPHSSHSEKCWRSGSCAFPTCSASQAASYTASATTSKPRPTASRTSAAKYATLLISLLMVCPLSVVRREPGRLGHRLQPDVVAGRGVAGTVAVLQYGHVQVATGVEADPEDQLRLLSQTPLHLVARRGHPWILLGRVALVRGVMQHDDRAARFPLHLIENLQV